LAEGRRKIFHRLLTIEEASEALLRNARAETGCERIGLNCAEGRVLAESVFSRVDLPPFDRAEMDGYAVASADLEGASDQAPVRLKVVGRIGAGEERPGAVGRGECAEIATGAPMPRGADAVVMVEYTEAGGGGSVMIFRSVTPGENVSSTGSDVQIGEMVLREGVLLGTREIGMLAAAGIGEVVVVRRPLVGIISTGNELVDAGEALSLGRIYDANSPALEAAVAEAGGVARRLGRVKDDFRSTKDAIEGAVRECDVVLVSGGTSAGAGDLVYKVLGSMDPGILVHGLNVKPGKPTVVAADGGKPVFGLPGYPVSALIIFDQLVRPYLERLGRRPRRTGSTLRGRLSLRVNSAKGRRWFLPVHVLRTEGGEASVYPIFASSGAIATLARADGYTVVGEGTEFLDAGEVVEVNLFEKEIPDLTVMGSHCPGLDILLKIAFERGGIRTKTANVGSLGGLNAIARGEADIAGVHLLDEETLQYNRTFVKDAGLPPESLVKGYRRLQGIIVRKGNPKRITGMADLLREGVVMVNRNRGSGTRALIDHFFREIAEAEGVGLGDLTRGISGYRFEAKTHSAVAAAVSQGRADAGVGVKSAAAAYGLDFIPLAEEEYDFIINPRSREKRPVKAFLEYLRSDDFREALKSLPGYSI